LVLQMRLPVSGFRGRTLDHVQDRNAGAAALSQAACHRDYPFGHRGPVERQEQVFEHGGQLPKKVSHSRYTFKPRISAAIAAATAVVRGRLTSSPIKRLRLENATSGTMAKGRDR